MFRSFVAWLDAFIVREEPASILKAIIGLLTFAGLLGTVFGSQTIRVGGFVAVIFFAVSATLLLLADRRVLLRREQELRDIIEKACNLVVDRDKKPLVSVEDWNETVYIQPNGDVEETLIVKATAVRREVHFIRLKAGCGWDQPDKYLKKVRMIVRGVGDNGAGGLQWITTRSWVSARRMHYYVHLYEPLRTGEKIQLEVKRTWPAKCLPLMRMNTAETFTFRISGLICVDKAKLLVVLPQGARAVYQPVGFIEPDPRNSIKSGHDAEKRQTFMWKAENVPPHETLGIRLQLET